MNLRFLRSHVLVALYALPAAISAEVKVLSGKAPPLQAHCSAGRRDWHMDVPTPQGREPLKTTLFKGEMQVGQDAPSCSFL